MHIKFLARGTGAGRDAAGYLLGEWKFGLECGFGRCAKRKNRRSPLLRGLSAPSGLPFPPGDPRLFSAGQGTVEGLLPELADGEAPT